VTTAERAVPSASDSLDTVHSRLATSRKRRRKKRKRRVCAGQMHSPSRRYSCHCTLLAILRNHREKLTVTSCSRHKNYEYFLPDIAPVFAQRTAYSSLGTAHFVQSRQNAITPIISSNSSTGIRYARNCIEHYKLT